MNTDTTNDEPFCYRYPRPAVSVDCVVVGKMAGRLSVLLIERGRDPYQGRWALPGGFVDQDEDLSVAAARELQEETQLSSIAMQQLAAFGRPGRDPRGHVVSVAYLAPVVVAELKPVAGDDAVNASWFAVDELPELAFDHDEFIAAALARLEELKQLDRYPDCLVD